MKRLSLRLICLLIVLSLTVSLLPGCVFGATLNGINIEEYTIIYDENATDYCLRAAQYLQAQILEKTGKELALSTASSGNYPHEILVGPTDRPLSTENCPETEGMEFAVVSDGNHIALQADYFIIAGAAYWFAHTYITGKSFKATVGESTVQTPITREAKNCIFLIGDGMGFEHIRMFEEFGVADWMTFHDGEEIFYGAYLPYQGQVETASLSGVTDSAAAATALACGFKTYNGIVARDEVFQDLQSITELAGSLGMATAVMATEDETGATPAGFSAHADNRDDHGQILDSQEQLKMRYGTIIECGLAYFGAKNYSYQDIIAETLETLEQDEDGFFVMYEESYIDKFSHSQDTLGAFECLVRFNQAIGVFMEHALYNPDTLVVITADHETGGLREKDGVFEFTSANHTGVNVPVFAYGAGAEFFDGCKIDNTQIPKHIAATWGVEDFGW